MVKVIEPRIVQALQLLGPEFHVVRTAELAKLRKISHASAQRIFQHLVQGNKNTHVMFSPSGALARKVMRDCWAINDHGQETMHWPQNADDAYREWLYVVCDKLDGEGRKEALEALAYVYWPVALRGESFVELDEDKRAWEELAFHVITTVVDTVPNPARSTKRTVKNAILSIHQRDLAERALDALQLSSDRWRREFLEADELDKDGYRWAGSHLKRTAAGRLHKPSGGGLWGDVGSRDDEDVVFRNE